MNPDTLPATSPGEIAKRPTLRRLAATAVALIIGPLCMHAAPAAPVLPTGFHWSPHVAGLISPVDLEWSPDGQALFITEKPGKVRVVENGLLLAAPFIDLSVEVNKASDRGLLGLALHPAFPSTPWVYLLYTYDPPQTAGLTGTAGPDGAGQRVSRLIRVTADSATNFRTAVPDSRVTLAGAGGTWQTIGDPAAEQVDLAAPWSCGPAGAYVNDCLPADGISHSIGTVAFGPDGMLYVGNGDAATWTTVDPRATRALDPNSLAGKILRIDPETGGGLPGNPYWDGNADSNRSKVWHLGLRNPYRFVFRPGSGELWIGDVGWQSWEELDTGTPGADFGWPCFEGGDGVSLQQPGYASTSECQAYYPVSSATASAYGYPHVPGVGGAVIPGAFYMLPSWPPDYHGAMIASEYASATLSRVTIDGAQVTDVAPFGEDIIAVDLVFGPDGALYTADPTTGVVGRIVYSADGPPDPGTRIASSDDDAEEREGGQVNLKNPRLELTQSNFNQTVGLRFTGVQAPPGGVVTDAYIQFTSARAESGFADLLIRGQASDDAPAFRKQGQNISSRPRTSAAVTWQPVSWTGADLAGSDQRTPSLTSIIGEIVNRPGWASGNAIAFIFTGNGRRTAYAYDGLPGSAPVLHVEWNSGANASPTVAITAPTDGAIFTEGNAIAFAAFASDAEDDDATLGATITWQSSLDGVLGTGANLADVVLSQGVHAISASVTDSGGATGDDSIAVSVTANNPPVATILAPDGAQTWTVDESVAFSGAGTDAEDGDLPGSALDWQATIHHNTHEHIDLLSATGPTGSFAYPDHDDGSYVELCLTVTDSGARTGTDCVDLLPREVVYTFQSVPTGLTLNYNGIAQTTPFSILAAVGGGRQIAAPSPQGAYSFDSWSIGGGASQQIVIGASDQTVVATFDSAPSEWTVEASYRADFVPGAPGPGWSYAWNGNAAIGAATGYLPLAWNGTAYDSDGVGGLPDGSQLRYGHLLATGGHAGQGQVQGASADRYVIAGYTIAGAASYRIAQSFVSLTGCQFSDGLDVRVFVDDSLARQVSVPAGGTTVDFDAPLGELSGGNVIYIAAGPSGRDGCDSFSWNFAIERSGAGGPANSAPVVVDPGNQSDTVGQTVSLQITATDADGDTLTYTMSGAPPGLTIDAATGLVSGVPGAAGTYTAVVIVSDGQAQASTSFEWAVASSGQTWSTVASYRGDFASTLPPGWLYQWNANGPIGSSSGYVDLAWNGSAWDSDGAAGFPDSTGMGYGRLEAGGGHAGPGVNQGSAYDRYAIAGYVATLPGEYRMAQSYATHVGCQWTNGLELRVYVNDTLVSLANIAGGGQAVFDGPLGTLAAGDRVYVAAGPDARDGCDRYAWDFVLERVD